MDIVAQLEAMISDLERWEEKSARAGDRITQLAAIECREALEKMLYIVNNPEAGG